MVFSSDKQRKAVMAKLNQGGARSNVRPSMVGMGGKIKFQQVFEISEAFAKGLRTGKARADRSFPQGRVFIDGNAIFSFGRHFPIAVKTGEKTAEFNTDKFSVTTTKQQSEVRRALISQGFKLKDVDTATIKRLT